MTGVIIKPGESFERALKRWSKSCEKSGIISDVKKKQRYEKPSDEKKRKRTAARRKAKKEAAELSQNRYS
ncbi:30S ribosomal protein S21 [Fibrobacterota bacterium]